MNTLTQETRPVNRPVEIARTMQPDLAVRPSLQETRPRILCVDDDESTRRVCQMLLARSGYDVDTAVDGVEALEALRECPYQLLFTDHDMPRLTGLELAAQARLAGMTLPIVLASGSMEALNDPDSGWLALAARLPKPFDAESLLHIVEQALSTASADGVSGVAAR